jgi:hypothetical protein
MIKIETYKTSEKRSLRMSTVSLLLLTFLLSGCVTARFTEPITSFRDSVNTTSVVIGTYYTELNKFEREVYLDDRLYGANEKERRVSFTEDGKPTALSGVFSAKSIRARTDALVLLGVYAKRLGDLAGSEAPQQFSESTRILGDNLFNLQKTFEELGKGSDAAAKNYFTPIGTIIGVIGNIYLQGERDAQVKIAIEKGAPAVRNVLDLLQKDFTDVIIPLQITGLKDKLSSRVVYYNSHLKDSFEQRKRMLADIEGIASRYDAAMNANPVNLIQAMRDAHEALIKYAGSPQTPQNFTELLSALETFNNYIQEVSKAVNQIRDLKKG